jgi:hypothetical protein
MLKRVATVALVGLLVTAAMVGGLGGPASPVGTAEATTTLTFPGCDSPIARAVYAVAGGLGVCQYGAQEQLTATDAYAAGVGMKDSSDRFIRTTENFQQDTTSVAWSKAKISIVNGLNDGLSKSEVKAKANGTVSEYYATQQKNVINEFSSKMERVAYLSDQTGGAYYQGNSNIATDDGSGLSTSMWVSNATGSAHYQLVNGEQHNYSILVSSDGSGQYNPNAIQLDYQYSSNYSYPHPMDGKTVSQGSELPLGIADAEGNITQIHDRDSFGNRLGEIRNQHQQVEDNIGSFVDAVYAEYTAGEIDSTDLVASDPTTIATQAATDYDSTGYYGLSNAQLAALGLSGQTNASHIVETTTPEGENRTIEGTIFYTGEDGISFTTGDSYDPSSLSGEVYMSVASLKDANGTEQESSGFYHVTEPFTIVEATNTKTGETVTNTTMETRDYSSTNATALAEELERLKDLRAYYESQIPTGTSGGATDSSGGLDFDFGSVPLVDDLAKFLGVTSGVAFVLGLIIIFVGGRAISK